MSTQSSTQKKSTARGKVKLIDIALQGGGSHGACTWGVLDRLLEDERIEIDGISGTSAGAMNAVALAQGLADGGPPRARELLEGFWSEVSKAAKMSPIQRSPFDVLLGRWSLDTSPGYVLSQQVRRSLSPYEFNPLDINPLRDVVAEFFDFDVINKARSPKLFLSATNVRTGRLKVFRQPDISADTAMASACLPDLFHAVEIDGEAYWDGGFMGNPPLFALIDETDADDLVIVQITPFERPDIPRTAHDIHNRLHEITFNASLLKDLRAALLLWEVIDHHHIRREAYRNARVHLISAEPEMRKLEVSSKLNAGWDFLLHLRDIGRETAERWLEESIDGLGVRSTWDPDFLLEESLRPAHLAEDVEREDLD